MCGRCSLGILYLEATRRKDHSENCIRRRFLYCISRGVISESIRIQRHRVLRTVEKRAFSKVFLYYMKEISRKIEGFPCHTGLQIK